MCVGSEALGIKNNNNGQQPPTSLVSLIVQFLLFLFKKVRSLSPSTTPLTSQPPSQTV